MAFRLAVLLAVFAAVQAVPHRSLAKRPNHDFIDYYDCSGKANGNYLHPFDCTRFITCSNGNAADMACPDCGKNNVAQCAGYDYLVYDLSKDRCEWPVDTTCQVDAPATDAPATDAPTTEKATDAPTDAPTTDAPAPEPTDAPAPEPTDAPAPAICRGLKEGDSCKKDDCEKCGYCVNKLSFYFRCERIVPSDPKLNVTGVIVHEACDTDLWWNPEDKPDAVREGGVCDKWENLSETVKNAYRSDESCVPPAPLCEYGQDEADRCSGRHWYLDPEISEVREDRNCPSGLLYDPSSETCRNRANVVNADGTGC